jgi:hypothetical protein
LFFLKVIKNAFLSQIVNTFYFFITKQMIATASCLLPLLHHKNV